MPEEIIKQTTTILDIISHTDHQISLQLKPSLDGIGPEQDKIRGVEGSFEKIHFLLRELRKLREVYPQLYVGVGTTISKLNISSLPDIVAYLEDLQVDSYIAEIAEIRAELFNQNMSLTPSVEEYNRILPLLIEISRKYRSRKRRLVEITQTFREIYYQLVADILQAKRQVLPCYAGISNVHLNPYGELWPCCVLGYKLPLGNLRDVDYSFRKVWHSAQAQKVRRFIQQAQCYCPLANQAYANILCNGKKLLQAITSFFIPKAYPGL
jgi:MoaA/NifB/PqqE/SkfB family radical SAM enzyme